MLKEEGKFKYIEKGEGEPVIILHGLMGAMSNFEEMMNDLSNKGFKVLLPELPLFSFNLINTNIKRLNKYLEEFIKFKGLEKFHLIGNSLGGHIALIYIKEHLEKVNSLTLLGSSGLYENAFGKSFPRRNDKNYIRGKISEVFYRQEVVTDELVDNVFEAVNNRNKIIKTLAISKSAIRHNMEGDLPNMNLPVCLIWGKNDNVTPPDVAEKFHKLFPKSELFWVDKCGHAPMMEYPKLVNELFIKWYNKTFLKK